MSAARPVPLARSPGGSPRARSRRRRSPGGRPRARRPQTRRRAGRHRAGGHRRRALRECRQLAPGAAERPVVQDIAAREHERHDQARLEFTQGERADDGEQRDHVGSQLAAQHPPQHREGERHDDGEQREDPEPVRDARLPRELSPSPDANASATRTGTRRLRTSTCCATRLDLASASPRLTDARNPQRQIAAAPMARGMTGSTVQTTARKSYVLTFGDGPRSGTCRSRVRRIRVRKHRPWM